MDAGRVESQVRHGFWGDGLGARRGQALPCKRCFDSFGGALTFLRLHLEGPGKLSGYLFPINQSSTNVLNILDPGHHDGFNPQTPQFLRFQTLDPCQYAVSPSTLDPIGDNTNTPHSDFIPV